jgi:hypothetical protein
MPDGHDPKCEYIYPRTDKPICNNRARYWVRRGEADILVCGQHLITTIKAYASPIPPLDSWWSDNSLITVALILESTAKPYPIASASFRSLRNAGRA